MIFSVWMGQQAPAHCNHSRLPRRKNLEGLRRYGPAKRLFASQQPQPSIVRNHGDGGPMLKIMTLNLNYRIDRYGPWPIRRNGIVRLLSQTRPNIVALQAVEEDAAGLDQAHELAQAAGYPHALFVPADTAGRRGSALLADRDPLIVRTRVLTTGESAEDPSERVVVAAQFSLDAGAVPTWIVNGHFSWVPDQNRANVREALETTESLGSPTVLLGDFNAPLSQPL